MPRTFAELRRTDDLAAEADRGVRDFVSSVVGGAPHVVVLAPGEGLVETAARDNVFALLPGDHGGFTLTRTNTLVLGHAGARVRSQVVVRADCRLVGLHFLAAAGRTGVLRLVDVQLTATALFERCRFEKAPNMAGDFVGMAAGSFAHFVGCLFGPAMGAGTFTVDNAGLAANASVVGCSRKTTLLHNNVTVLSETT